MADSAILVWPGNECRSQPKKWPVKQPVLGQDGTSIISRAGMDSLQNKILVHPGNGRFDDGGFRHLAMIIGGRRANQREDVLPQVADRPC